MRKIAAFMLLISIAGQPVSAQKKLSQTPRYVEWADAPKVHAVPPEYANEPAFYQLYDIDIDYRYEGNDINTFYTRHTIVKVLDELGIERFNKIQMPVYFGTRVPSIKARTITPGGRVYDIAKDMIKVTKDESGYYTVIIAMEGVEKNSEVEVLIKTIRPMTASGQIPFQFSIPVANARFHLSYPKNMVVSTKSHNGFPILQPQLRNNRNNINVELADIAALEDEPNSFYGQNRMSIEYRTSYFTNDFEHNRLFSWDSLSRKLYNDNYRISDKERKAVNGFLSQLGVHANGNEAENIRKIENGIKTQIALYHYVDYDERKDVLDSIVSKKAATPSGYVRLFAACLTQAGVAHRLGRAADRSDYRLDPKFENWSELNNTLFYFPRQKKFLSPTSEFLRYPVVPADVVGGKGVFSTIPQRGDLIGGLYEIRTITPLTEKETQQNITASVSFTKDMDAQVDAAMSYSGYFASQLRSQLAILHKDKVKDVIKGLIPYAGKPSDIEKFTITNDALTSYYTGKPLEIYAQVNTDELVEKGGKKYLFKVGELAGAHDELYTKEERRMPADLQYPYTRKRTITVNIPKGYKILNPEVLNTGADYLNENINTVIGFTSGYKLVKDAKKGDKLVIRTSEFYTQLHFSLDEYERFRKVMNTAADFNKITLLMAKK